jgi:hypothetical protein
MSISGSTGVGEFIEEVLAPLQITQPLVPQGHEGTAAITLTDPAHMVMGFDDSGPDHAIQVLTQVLAKIERRPLRATERRTIQRDVLEYMKVHNIRHDCKLSQQFSHRMQYDYLPTVSDLGLIKTPETIVVPSSPPPETDPASMTTTGTVDDTTTLSEHEGLPEPFSLNIPGKCFLCTLQRSKSTLWTSYRLFLVGIKDNCDVTCPLTRLHKSVLLLAARKLKSGMSSQYQMWRSADTKMWKEKSAEATLTKFSQSSYIGRAHVDGHVGNSRGCTIAISVVSKSIDKLIHITAVVSSLQGTDGENGAVDVLNDSDDGALQELLQSAASQNNSPLIDGISQGPQQAVEVLRSKPPRKVPTVTAGATGTKGKEMHTLAFSHDCRVRAPSRKNIVIESLNAVAQSLPPVEGISKSILWTESTAPTPNPLFQVIKA